MNSGNSWDAVIIGGGFFGLSVALLLNERGLSDCVYKDSLWEVKTVLPLSDIDDGRPILFRPSQELPGLIHLMGGKIDNIYDIPQELDSLFHGN